LTQVARVAIVTLPIGKKATMRKSFDTADGGLQGDARMC
jgi:hypothetical protein